MQRVLSVIDTTRGEDDRIGGLDGLLFSALELQAAHRGQAVDRTLTFADGGLCAGTNCFTKYQLTFRLQ